MHLGHRFESKIFLRFPVWCQQRSHFSLSEGFTSIEIEDWPSSSATSKEASETIKRNFNSSIQGLNLKKVSELQNIFTSASREEPIIPSFLFPPKVYLLQFLFRLILSKNLRLKLTICLLELMKNFLEK